MKKIFLGIIFVTLCCAHENVFACHGLSPKPISIDAAFEKADAVFLGKVVEIHDGFPADFKPDNLKEFNERKADLERQNKSTIGRTIIFELLKSWKNRPSGSQITLVEPYSQNTCEWNYDVQVNDNYIIFASHYGNYLTFPAMMFDGRSGFTKHDPSKRNYTDSQKERYSKSIQDEKTQFQSILKKLERIPVVR
jgi:hypothetical protein